ncbi:F-box/kelch-repeat protein At3g06240-like [Papaver somniferum]|uniref:F-box/kelch-repeat protein At3g06240-like n=1 Tax=Papaver somniferum TaxID=3469 RepID=UPI000E6F9467|nr:F-box/kelch-repeat protein At3g06240-like [Papaver somniferum]
MDNDRVKYGFGYDRRISDYKLVRIADYENTGCFNIHVYTLRSDSWRSTQTNFPYLFARQARPSGLLPSGLLFNGALHWLGTQKTSSESAIISFDIINGRLLDFPYPEETMSELEDSRELFKNLCVLEGCLCLVLIYRYVLIDVWVMHNYGERESWKKWFTVPKSTMTRSYFWQPIWSFNDEEILVDNLSSLVVYDIKNTTTRNVFIAGVCGPRNQPESYVESLAQLYSGTYARSKSKSKSKRKRGVD